MGWDGEISYKGKKYAYSEEAAKMLLAHRDFRDTVSKVASDMETFKLVKDEEDEKLRAVLQWSFQWGHN